MSHWFHRNVLKATTQVNFDMAMISSEPSAIKLCSDLKACRRRLLELLPDPGHTVEAIESVFSMYLALLHGLLFVPGENTPSKLRHNTLFKWTHSLLGNTPQLQNDAMFEAANMSCNVAFWFMKHAAMMAAKDDITMEEAKEVHTSLRKAAGIFKLVESEFGPKLTERQLEGGDLDPRVMSAYLTQCTAEAQEVTMARAMELKHNPSLISALANETYKLFSDAARVLEPLGDVTAQWIKYLRLKAAVYQAYAYCFCGENLLSQDKCGEAIRALQESKTCYNSAVELCKEYAKTKGPASKIHPEKHSFFKRLAPKVQITLEKCERENGFIYHQRTPADPPELELKATYGLVSPNEVPMPSPSPLWTPVTYAAFDTPKTNSKDPANSKAAAKVEGDLPPVAEVKVHHTVQEPKTSSGCELQ
ncbi:BRO1 domain-containing protein BROX-like isoform X1 [Periplaneta americana]|uniref:BRO1 domain-containing protein BROX-like isoform X1 n=1 Tax=Periplaneta americana TaxID=6978 RepID=UPI0037E7D751